MHKDMDLLYELQQIDTAIAELETDLAALDDGSKLQAELAAAEEELARRQEEQKRDHTTQSQKEAELEKTEEKRKQLMDKAYGGVVSNPKELETLEQEIEALTRAKDRLENELLELFDVVDKESRVTEEQRELVDRLRAQLKETVEHYESERTRITEQIANLRHNREQLNAQLDPEVISKYERIRERCGNVAVVAVEGQLCSGCRVSLPVVQVRRLAQTTELEQCENCLRLLWMPRE